MLVLTVVLFLAWFPLLPAGAPSVHLLHWSRGGLQHCDGRECTPGNGRLGQPLLVHALSRTVFSTAALSPSPGGTVLLSEADHLHDAPLVAMMEAANVTDFEWSACGGSLLGVAAPDGGPRLLSPLWQREICSVSRLHVCGAADGSERRRLTKMGAWVGATLGSPFTAIIGGASNDAPPIHTQPTGVFLRSRASPSSVPSSSGSKGTNRSGWCSLHYAEHDTLCTHHMSSFLLQPQDDATAELLEALPSAEFFLSTAYHHFSIHAQRGAVQDAVGLATAEVVTVTKTLTFVVSWEDEVSALLALPAYRSQLLPALQASKARTDHQLLKVPAGSHEGGGGGSVSAHQRLLQDDSASGTVLWDLFLHAEGGDDDDDHHSRGNSAALRSLTVEMMPIVPLKIGTPILHSLAFIPPPTSSMSSSGNCSVKLQTMLPHFDSWSETVVALLQLTIQCREGRDNQMSTSAPPASSAGNSSNRFFLGSVRLDLDLSFVHQEQLPPNANKAFFLPNALLRYRLDDKDLDETRAEWRGEGSGAAEESGGTGIITLVPTDSFKRMFQLLGTNAILGEPASAWTYQQASGVCVVTLSIGDPAMVFNAVALGMLGPTMLIGGLLRVLLSYEDHEKQD
jgi:hypothetical protein